MGSVLLGQGFQTSVRYRLSTETLAIKKQIRAPWHQVGVDGLNVCGILWRALTAGKGVVSRCAWADVIFLCQDLAKWKDRRKSYTSDAEEKGEGRLKQALEKSEEDLVHFNQCCRTGNETKCISGLGEQC